MQIIDLHIHDLRREATSRLFVSCARRTEITVAAVARRHHPRDAMHFHDMRHETTSRLFEAGLTIEQVPLVTGHKDWKMLKRYTQLRPEGLYAKLKAK